MGHVVTNEELIADMLAVYADLGYLTVSSYSAYGSHHNRVIERRFGSWSNACQIANIPTRRKNQVPAEMKATTCLSCDEWFERPADDKSCRRCKACRKTMYWQPDVAEDFAQC